MRRLAVLILAAVLIIGLAAPAYAGDRNRGSNTTANVALGLASLAVFNQVVSALTDNHRWHQRTVVYEQPVYERTVYVASAPVVYYTTPAVIVAPPPPPPPPAVVTYPHGRYELSGQQWVWIPNPPSPPPPPAAEPCQYTGRYVKTPHGLQPECR